LKIMSDLLYRFGQSTKLLVGGGECGGRSGQDQARGHRIVAIDRHEALSLFGTVARGARMAATMTT
jgi:hypothetical protein